MILNTWGKHHPKQNKRIKINPDIIKMNTPFDLEIDIPAYFWTKIIVTGILLILIPSIKYLTKRFVVKTGLLNSKSELRIAQTSKLISMIINLFTIVTIAIIWGVDPGKVFVVFSSVFAIIGVALFAQWSVLSNITAGIIIFFSMPFRIGDKIEIIDKDHPIVATVENVLTFTIHLRTDEGDLVVMSNTQFLQKVFSIKGPKS